MFCGQSTIYFTSLNHGRLSKSEAYVKVSLKKCNFLVIFPLICVPFL